MKYFCNLLFFCWIAYADYNTESHFVTGTHLDYRIVHSKRTGHLMGDWDIQDMAYRAAHPPLK